MLPVENNLLSISPELLLKLSDTYKNNSRLLNFLLDSGIDLSHLENEDVITREMVNEEAFEAILQAIILNKAMGSYVYASRCTGVSTRNHSIDDIIENVTKYTDILYKREKDGKSTKLFKFLRNSLTLEAVFYFREVYSNRDRRSINANVGSKPVMDYYTEEIRIERNAHMNDVLLAIGSSYDMASGVIGSITGLVQGARVKNISPLVEDPFLVDQFMNLIHSFRVLTLVTRSYKANYNIIHKFLDIIENYITAAEMDHEIEAKITEKLFEGKDIESIKQKQDLEDDNKDLISTMKVYYQHISSEHYPTIPYEDRLEFHKIDGELLNPMMYTNYNKGKFIMTNVSQISLTSDSDDPTNSSDEYKVFSQLNYGFNYMFKLSEETSALMEQLEKAAIRNEEEIFDKVLEYSKNIIDPELQQKVYNLKYTAYALLTDNFENDLPPIKIMRDSFFGSRYVYDHSTPELRYDLLEHYLDLGKKDIIKRILFVPFLSSMTLQCNRTEMNEMINDHSYELAIAKHLSVLYVNRESYWLS